MHNKIRENIAGIKRGIYYLINIINLLALLLILPVSSDAFNFSDDFSAGSYNWTPISGAWVAEDGQYIHKEIGESYLIQSSQAFFSDDFSIPNPSISSTELFTDSFTVPDGPASLWSVKRGTFSVVNNEYIANSGSATLSIPADNNYTNWADYRINAKIKRGGAADAYGYAIIYFRLTMVDATKDNSYALLFRQTGVAELWKRVNGSWSSNLASFAIPKDNDWHNVIALINGSSLKVWFDKADSQSPDISVNNLTDYATGTIGTGTNAWNSSFDDIQVDNTLINYRWLDIKGQFNVQNGEYYATASGSKSLSILADASSSNWTDYKITTKVKRNGAADDYGYGIIYFRVTMVDATKDNSYALIFRQTGKAELWKRVNGNWSGVIASFDIPEDNNWHNVIVLVKDISVKVWFDKNDIEYPNLSINGLSDYTVGTIGLGTIGWDSSFDDFITEPLFSIEPAPSHLYTNSNNTAVLSISSSSVLNNLQLTVTNPSNISWNLNNPSQCIGNKTCNVVFPTDFPGADISTQGTYKISASDGVDASYSLLEVREKPLFAFMQITDLHDQYSQINNFVTDVNNTKYFPLPDFVIMAGDLTDNGTTSELVQAKAKLDNLIVPYFPVTGNHDTLSETGSNKGLNWATTFGPDKFTYSWTVGNFLFLAMDVEASYGGYGGNLGSVEHKNWLQYVLDANPDKYVFVVSHYALNAVRDGGIFVSGYWSQNYWQGESTSSAVRPIMESQGKVIAEFSGHNHMNGMSVSNGIHYLTTASFKDSGEFRYFEVYGDRIESQVIRKRYYCSINCYDQWTGATDSTHDVSTYTYGLPIERHFKIQYATRTSAILDGISVAGDISWQDYTYKADINLGNKRMMGENTAGLVFRYNDKDNYYSVLLDSASDTIKLQKNQNGAITDIASVPALIGLYNTYHLKVNIQYNRIKIYLNDVVLIDASDSTFISGKIGLRSFLSNSNFDNVSVVLDATNADPNGPYIIASGQMLTLDGSDSNVPNGKNIVLYEWDINNDGVFDYSSSLPTLNYLFSLPGIYNVRLRVTDNLGLTDEALATVYVMDNVPTANFTAYPTLGNIPLTVNFTNLSTGDYQPLSYEWDFDNDGIIDSTEQNPSYTYTNSGLFTVKLTVTDSNGSVNSIIMSDYINIGCVIVIPVRIFGPTPVNYSSVQAAYDAAMDGDVIQVMATRLNENVNFNFNKSVTLEGGYNCDYTTVIGQTIINGLLTITDGLTSIESVDVNYN